MAITLNRPAGEPLGDLNTTPLIDVMLVLLVMFILSVPVAQHSLMLDLPRPGPVDPATPIKAENVLSVTPQAAVTWNGKVVDDAALTGLLQTAAAMDPEPVIRFEPAAEAPYDTTLKVLNLAKAANPGLFALSGNERYASFGRDR